MTISIILVLCGAVSAADDNTGIQTDNSPVDIQNSSSTNPDPPLNITKGSWDTAGLDSNNVNVGPNQTIIQFRVNNPDPTNTAHNVVTNFAWTSSNSYINLAPGETATKNLGDILPGQTKDVFYLVEITRNSGAYLTSRNYQVTIAGTDTPTYSPTGSIFVEKLLSQQRNDVTGISISPGLPHVGEPFNVTVTSTTGSSQYPELALPLVSYNPGILIPLGMVTTYTDTNNVLRTTNNVYIPNPQGNAFTTIWTFVFTSAGMSDLYPVIYDRSGSSYHYNADFGELETAVVPADVGNWVWNDANANGMQDPGELGVPNVLVTLYNSTGSSMGTQVTDANGFYYFNDVYPGDYYIIFSLPSGYSFSPFYGPAYDNKAGPSGQTATFTLSPGETDYTWDAGIYQPASVGDFVWNDQNANGIYDGIGHGILGVAVDLYDSIGTHIASTTTDANGFYLFSNVLPGSYYIHFTLPAGFNFSPYIFGITDNKALSTGNTPVFALTAGQTLLTEDAGMYQNATLGNFVWEDLNANGIWDAGEPGIPNVTVQLYQQNGPIPIATTTTDANGNYLFTNITPGNYFVKFVKPSGYIFSPANQGVNDQIDSDADPITGETPTITLTSGETDLSWDAGMYRQATVGDFVWMDLNRDGYYNGADYPLANIIVNLFNGSGVQIDSTVTNANGNYLFTGLNPGSYYVQFVAPSGYVFSLNYGAPYQNMANSLGFTSTFTLISGDAQLQWDAGMLGGPQVQGTLGDYVWDDQNADGINQGRGHGIPGVIVRLFLEGGTIPIATTTTNLGGFYYFSNLQPSIIVGNYFIEFLLPAGYNFSPYIAGVTNNTANPTPGPNFGRTPLITLGIGETQLQWDAGMYQNVTIGDWVWDDQNANGIFDGNGHGIAGVTVNLLYQNGTPTGLSDVTDANGYYLFENLTPGDYIVEFILKTGYVFSPYIGPVSGQTTNTADPSTGKTPTITLTSGQTQLQWDAAMFQHAELGDFVWNDLNVNGMIDAGEPGIPGIIVNLYTQGIKIASTLTDANGYYYFTNLNPGDYFLEFIKPAGFNFSPYIPGVTDNTANANGQTAVTTLVSGEHELFWDAGMWQPASVGSFVWNDQNANGIFEGRGTGIPNIQVELYDGTGTNLLGTTFTDATGFYQFTNLVAGNYVLRFILPSGFFFSPEFPVTDNTITSKPNPVTGFTPPLTLAAGENNPYIDAGMWQPVTIGNWVWNDLNRNGIQDAGEPGFANVPVELYDLSSTLIATTTTNSNGYYLFENQRPDFYYVKFIKPSGYLFSPQYAGTNPAIDSDAFPVNGETGAREFTSGMVYLDLDAGLMREQADLSITKTVNPNSVTVGQEVTYTIIIQNNGPDTARNVRVTDILPEGVAFMDYTASVGTYDPATGIWTIGDLENGQTATLTIKANATRTGVFNNVAVVSSDTYDPDMENNRATASLTVREPVKAATVPMQPTGLPTGYLALAVLMVLAGVLIPKKK